jgi:acyl carrier protein
MAIEDIHQNKRLVAYVVSEDDDFSSQQLREFLQQQLPAYMVPSVFVILDTLPLTPNGKVDRQALPAPNGEIDRSREYVAPRTETEQILANIWQELLLVERVSIHDNFFELGGHSLLATSLIFRIRQIFTIDLPLRHLFEAPTIATLNCLIEQLRAEQILADLNNCLSREPVLSQQNHSPGTPLPLSLAQQYIWHMHQAGEPGAALNSTIAIRIRETLSPIVLEQSFNEIIHRHEVLRTVFTIVDDRPMQVVMPELHLPLFYEDLQHLSPDRRESAALSLVMNSIKRPFDLCAAPLIRVSCIRFAPEEYGLFIVAHHIITDGWSLGLLISELNTLIQAFSEGKPSPLLPVDYQYTDFALWQQQVVSADSLTRQLTYWQHKLVEEVDPIESNSFSSSPLSSKRAGRHVANFPTVLASAVESFCRAKGVTPFVVLLAGLKLTLAKWSGRQEILVGATIGNRTVPGTESMLGCFINDVILRSHLSPTHNGLTLIQTLQVTLNEAIDNKDVPLHQVIEQVQKLRSLTLMANITLTPSMQASDDLPSWEAIDWYEQEYVADDHPIELCDKTTPLEFYVEISQTVRIVIHYSIEVFAPETIESLMTSYQDLLSQLVAQPETFLAEWIGSRFDSKK